MRLLAFERRWVASVFDTLLPSGAGERLSLSASESGAPDRFSEELTRFPFPVALGMRLLCAAFVLFPVFFIGVPLPLTWLRPAARARYLDRWSKSRIYYLRQGVLVLKLFACMAYLEAPAVRRALGLALPSVPPDQRDHDTDAAG